jgi:CheY-like chemotaxis protein
MKAAIEKQMTQTSFEGADALVFDPVATNRGTARTALSMLGFRQVTATSVFDEFQSLVASRLFDLLVVDVTQDPSKMCGMVRTIRAGHAAANPFQHIILMAWKLEGDLVQHALNCGADDLITRPFSVDFLGARIRAHAELRKAFVVTSDYIGPDRRRARMPQPASNLFNVPNTLLAKAHDPAWFEDEGKSAQDKIKEAVSKVNAERARKDVFQIAFLMHFLRESWDTMAPLEDDLMKIEALTRDLVARVGEADSSTQGAAMLAAVAGSLSGENVAAHVDEMGRLSAALLRTLSPSQDPDSLEQEVAEAVAAAKSRGRRH